MSAERYVAAIRNDGVPYGYAEIKDNTIWELFKRHGKVIGDNIIGLPEKLCKMTRREPLRCLYTATESYLKNMLGRGLHFSDVDFFLKHPLLQEHGTPLPVTLRVAQEIIAPYGLGISRVRLVPGTNVAGDMEQWQSVLGVNPMALLSRNVSNEQFAKTTGIPLVEVDREYRFDFSEEPLGAAVSCDARTGKGGFQFGHAEFKAPRQKVDSFILQFQIQPVEMCGWKKPPVFEAVPPHPGMWEVSVYQTRWELEKTYEPFPRPGPINSKPRKDLPVIHSGNVECRVCRKTRTQDELVAGALCNKCWTAFCAGYTCGSCKANLLPPLETGDPKFAGMHRDAMQKWWLDVECPTCTKETRVEVEGKSALNVFNALRWRMGGGTTLFSTAGPETQSSR